MILLRPEWAAAALALIALAIAACVLRARRRSALQRALHARAVAAAPVREALVVAAAACCSAAMLGASWDRAPRAGAPSPIVVLDVSRSMAARDAVPDRGAAGRRAAQSVLLRGRARTAGLVAFADTAALVEPPDARADVTVAALAALGSDRLAPGSRIVPAVTLALAALGADGGAGHGGGDVVIVSDGESSDGDEALAALARDARRAGVRLHAITVGEEAPAAVPGAAEPSRARTTTLAALARATGGSVARADDPAGLVRLADAVGGTVANPRVGAFGSEGGAPRDGAPVLAAVALALLLIEALAAAARPWRVVPGEVPA